MSDGPEIRITVEVLNLTIDGEIVVLATRMAFLFSYINYCSQVTLKDLYISGSFTGLAGSYAGVFFNKLSDIGSLVIGNVSSSVSLVTEQGTIGVCPAKEDLDRNENMTLIGCY